MKLSELAALTGARRETSDGDIEVTGASDLEQAEAKAKKPSGSETATSAPIESSAGRRFDIAD